MPIGVTSVPKESVPATMVTPASLAARTAACKMGVYSLPRAARIGFAELAMLVMASMVGVKNVPRRAISLMVFSVMKTPCSMLRTPARTAPSMPSAL
ncbi:hypothetical protein D3C73_1373930 [compost metagenome]